MVTRLAPGGALVTAVVCHGAGICAACLPCPPECISLHGSITLCSFYGGKGVPHSFLQMGGRFLALKKFFNKNKIHTVRLMQHIFYLHYYVSADIPPFFPPSMSATK